MSELITDEIVEAAARDWWHHDREEMHQWARLHGVEPEPDWDGISDTDREHVREDVIRPALEAAAPLIAARALEEAADDWRSGLWAAAPRRADRVQERIANGQFVQDWLRQRAARQKEGRG